MAPPRRMSPSMRLSVGAKGGKRSSRGRNSHVPIGRQAQAARPIAPAVSNLGPERDAGLSAASTSPKTRKARSSALGEPAAHANFETTYHKRLRPFSRCHLPYAGCGRPQPFCHHMVNCLIYSRSFGAGENAWSNATPFKHACHNCQLVPRIRPIFSNSIFVGATNANFGTE